MSSIKAIDLFSVFNTSDFFTDKPLPVLETVNKSDIKLLEMINLSKYNAYVAGGAALRWYQGLPAKSHDIDIWFESQIDMRLMSSEFSPRYSLRYSSDNAETFEITVDNNTYRVQLIKPKKQQTIQEIIESFDITVTQVATNGTHWWIGKNFAQDLKHRRLRFNKLSAISSKRLIKYWAYGFEPDSSTLQSIIDNPETIWNYENTTAGDDYDHVII